MKAIFSHLDFNSHFFCDVELAKLTNSYAQQQGYKTCLYTDEKGYNKLTPSINYDEVILFDKNITSRFNPNIWSMGKILAMSMVKEPFMHIDFDLFLMKPLDNDFINKDFFSLYLEPWLFKIPSYEKNILQIYNLYPNPEELNFNDFYSYNFAVVGGQKFKEINYVCSKLVEFSIAQNKKFDEIVDKRNFSEGPNRDFFSHHWSLAVIFEQIMIQNLLSTIFNIEIFSIPDKKSLLEIKYSPKMSQSQYLENNLKCKALLKKFLIDNRIIHLHGEKEKKFDYLKQKLTIKKH
jgi:hypothetical protein